MAPKNVLVDQTTSPQLLQDVVSGVIDDESLDTISRKLNLNVKDVLKVVDQAIEIFVSRVKETYKIPDVNPNAKFKLCDFQPIETFARMGFDATVRFTGLPRTQVLEEIKLTLESHHQRLNKLKAKLNISEEEEKEIEKVEQDPDLEENEEDDEIERTRKKWLKEIEINVPRILMAITLLEGFEESHIYDHRELTLNIMRKYKILVDSISNMIPNEM